MNGLSEIFNKCNISSTIEKDNRIVDDFVFSLDDLVFSLDEIRLGIQIDNLAILTIVNWIRTHPSHCFPKRVKEWINTINGNRHLNCVRIYNSVTRTSLKYYIEASRIFNLLIRREYLYQINFRIYCNRQLIESVSDVYTCGKRKSRHCVIDRPLKYIRDH
jgi:hypothetical protein